MTFADYLRGAADDSLDTLSILIRAGLGDIPQRLLHASQYDAAMRGEQVAPTREQLRAATRGERSEQQKREYLSPAAVLEIRKGRRAW